ncbi:S-adenosyl-L-methionine-dependent methyltransferase [Dactylonectria macrodidyma]|uniref:tRNA (guanine(26)-N(2))-dimethyltransferase n=1 Tax=Dactylonectria macrodidyma TaxID=307937 RepID=A0A9P9FMU7_9HYPO|nr:S-adenosyl-L-methionine-dependent methyltransferase [Dactylonectria macrodidyma]
MAGDTLATSTVELGGKEYRTVKEGKATILVPQGAKIGEDRGEVQQVFYNPIQQYNRDLSVLAIKTYGEEIVEKRRKQYEARMVKQGKKRKRDDDIQKPKENATEVEKPVSEDQPQPQDPPKPDAEEKQHKSEPPKSQFKILDALSASGLRALRYAHELPFVTSVKANDLSDSAAETIKMNVSHNGLEDKVSVTQGDALAHMYRAIADDLSHRDRLGNSGKAHKFDVIDLDPYGTAAPFFDAAVQAVRDDGGLLCITCTDSAVWAGHSYCEKTYALYGGIPIKGLHSHESGLRLVLNGVATSAARYGLAIEPLLSLSIDFYTKFFIRVTKSPQSVKFLAAKTMLVYSCDNGCGAWETQPLMRSKPTPNKKGSSAYYKHTMALGPTTDRFCQHCGFKMHINGPMYGGHIHSKEFIHRLLDQIPKADPSIYGTLPRLEGMLRTALEEYLEGPEVTEPVDPKDAQLAAVDHYPFFVIPSKLSSVISCTTPSEDMFRGALMHLGYRTTRSHCRPGSIKTDAPWSTIWWVMTEWIRQKSPITEANIKSSTAAWKILREAGLVGREDAGLQEVPAKDQPTEMEGVEQQEPLSANANEPGDAPIETEAAALTEEELRKTLVFNEDLARLWRRRGEQKITPPPEVLPVDDVVFTDGSLTWIRAGSSEKVDRNEFLFILEVSGTNVASPESIICCLKEYPEDREKPFHLSLFRTAGTPANVPEQYIIKELPPYLRHEADNEVDVIVSTKSGVGLALRFWEDVLLHLWQLIAGLGDEERTINTDDRRASDLHYRLTITQSAETIRDFAKSLWASDHQGSKPRTIVLLSGDGGVVDLLNGSDQDSSHATLPLMAQLPLGTGNALFHSIHRPLYQNSGPSPLVHGLRTLFRGTPSKLPVFRASFSPGSRIVTFADKANATGESKDNVKLSKEETSVSHLNGAIVASYGFHASIVYESDTPEYRVHGNKRFGMVAQELLREAHPYDAQVSIRRSGSSKLEEIPRDTHAYAYDEGKHVDMKWDDGEKVGYEEVEEVQVVVLEDDERWRKVCIDGTIVEIPRGGKMNVTILERGPFRVLADYRLLRE